MNVTERQVVADYITNHPEQTYHQIARRFECSFATITRIVGEFSISRKTGLKGAE